MSFSTSRFVGGGARPKFDTNRSITSQCVKRLLRIVSPFTDETNRHSTCAVGFAVRVTSWKLTPSMRMFDDGTVVWSVAAMNECVPLFVPPTDPPMIETLSFEWVKKACVETLRKTTSAIRSVRYQSPIV